MSRIKAVDFAKSVDNSRTLLTETLKSKGIDVDKNDSLMTSISKVNQLPELEEVEVYTIPSEFQALMTDYENDPLMKRNGGEYEYCYYAMYSDLYDQVYYPSGCYGTLAVTSDGQELTLSGTTTDTFTITWDKTKDLTRDNGDKYRWVKHYSKYNANFKYFASGYPDSSTTNTSSILFLLCSLHSVNFSTSRNARNAYCYGQIEGLVFGYEQGTVSNASNSNSAIQYAKFYNELSTWSYGLSQTLYKLDVKFSSIVNITSGIGTSMYGINTFKNFHNVTSLTSNTTPFSNGYYSHIDLSNLESINLTGSGSSKFLSDCYNLEDLYLTKTTNISAVVTISLLNASPKIGTIVFNPELTTTNITLYLPAMCRNLILPNVVDFSSIAFYYARLLSKEIVLDAISRLKDFSSSNEVHKIMLSHTQHNWLSEEQLTEITNKNWTISVSSY